MGDLPTFMRARKGVAIPQSLEEDLFLRFSQIHHHWTRAMGAHLRAIDAQVDMNGGDRMLRQKYLGECPLQVLDVFLYATLKPSRDTIVDNSIRGKQTSICVPFTIIYCIAIARQNILDLDAV